MADAVDAFVMGRLCAQVEGYNLQAAMRIAANDREALELQTRTELPLELTARNVRLLGATCACEGPALMPVEPAAPPGGDSSTSSGSRSGPRMRAYLLDLLALAGFGWAVFRLYVEGPALDVGGLIVHGAGMAGGLLLGTVASTVRRVVTRRHPQPHLLAPLVRRLVGALPAGAGEDAAQPRWPLWAGMAATTMAVLLIELLITRLFSVTLYYHFAFMAISLALLGLGFSGILVFLLAPRFPPERLYVQIAWLSVAAALTSVAAAIAILRIEVALEFSHANFAKLLRVYLIAFVPLLLAGLIVTLLFTHRSKVAGRLYFFDLTGAAMAGPLLVPLTAWLGAPRALVLGAAVLAVGGGLLASLGRYRRGVLMCGACAVALTLTALAGGRTSVFDLRYAKGRAQSQVLFSKWNSFSRVAVYDRNHEVWGLSRNYKGPVPPSLWLDIDASASTPITIATGPLTNIPHFQWVLTAYGYKLRPGGEAMIIGAGGGRDLLSALNHGFKRVDGVEINDIIVRDLMLGRFREASGGIYQHPGVQVHLDDGRSFVRRSDRRVDVIQMSLVDTWAATSAGAYVLSENNLYTVEAVVDYLEHLKPDGVLSVARWPQGSLRMLSLFMEAGKNLRLGDPRRKVVVLGFANLIQMLFKKVDFTDAELATLLEHSQQQGFSIHYLPSFAGRIQPDSSYAQMLADPSGFIARSDIDLTPVTDDRPFFFNFTRVGNIPEQLMKSKFLFGDGLGNLLSVLFITLVMVALCFFVPMGVWFVRRRRRPAALAAPEPVPWPARGRRMLLYFSCLGFGYIVVEIVLIQKLTLLLGHPTTSLVVSLSGILAGSGLGAAFIARRSAKRPVTHARLALLAVVVVVLLMTLFLQPLVTSVISALQGPRIAIALAIVFAAGFAMGIPLPLGIRILDRHPDDHALIPWAWGLNGALSVFGSCAAIFIAMFFGFNNAMRAGAAAYLLALLIALTLSDRAAASPE